MKYRLNHETLGTDFRNDEEEKVSSYDNEGYIEETGDRKVCIPKILLNLIWNLFIV